MQQTQYQQIPAHRPTPQPVAVLTQGPRYSPDQFQRSAISQMNVLCTIQIAIGTVALFIGTVMMIMGSGLFSNTPHDLGRQAYGVWTGLYFIIVGALGMRTVKSDTTNWIIMTMILNIICAVVFCWVLVGYSSAGLIGTSYYCHHYFIGYGCFTNVLMRNGYYAMDGMLLIISVIQFVVTIWSAALCCGAVCHCCKTPIGRAAVQQQVATSYPMGQTAISVQYGYPVGVHQVPVRGYVPQPMYQPQAPVGYAVQSQPSARYSVPAQPQGPPGYPGQAPVGYQPPPAYHSGGEGMK